MFILIFITLGVIVLNIDSYCFSYENQATGEKINECGKKSYLEEKYKKYLQPDKINFSNINYTHETTNNFTYPN